MDLDFWKANKFMAVDARYGGMPVATAADIMGGKPKRQRPAKRWTWDDCKALAAILSVSLGCDCVLFSDGSFEHGKRYGYRNPSQCYEALLSLQRDRLARLSDANAIAAGLAAKECF